MIRSERLLFSMPAELPTANVAARVDPNNGFPADAKVRVFTDDGHMFSFEMFKKGPAQADYLISLVSAEPPITVEQPYEKEIYVKDDIIIQGKEFTLESALPTMFGRTTFRALEILSNVELLVVPRDEKPRSHKDDPKEVI